MDRHGKAIRAVVSAITKSSDRSPLFWWLKDHHDEIVAAAAGKRLQWESLRAQFEEAGLTDLTGKPPTAKTAKVTWQRVKQTVAQERARQAAEAARPKRVGATPPSRIPHKWRPEEVGSPRPQQASQRSALPAPRARAGPPAPTKANEAAVAEPFDKDLDDWLARKAERFEKAFDDWLTRNAIAPEEKEDLRAFYESAYEHDSKFRMLG